MSDLTMRTLRALPRRHLGIVLVLAIVAAASFALVAGDPPAQAGPPGWSLNMGWGHGGVTDSRYYAFACDDENDGRNVSTQYRYDNGVFDEWAVTDPSSAGGCVEERVLPDGPITAYRVCKQGWYPVTGPSCNPAASGRISTETAITDGRRDVI